MNFETVVAFHGHACPGLALGYRVSRFALKELGARAVDEELVAIVENNSCAVDAIQVMLGCTFGKGNLVFRDYGKQVYTVMTRPDAAFIRVAVTWEAPPESVEMEQAWAEYRSGNRSDQVLGMVHDRKASKMAAILAASDAELFAVQAGRGELPAPARIYPSVVCSLCGEKVMEPRARLLDSRIACIPCRERRGG